MGWTVAKGPPGAAFFRLSSLCRVVAKSVTSQEAGQRRCRVLEAPLEPAWLAISAEELYLGPQFQPRPLLVPGRSAAWRVGRH